MKLEHTWSVFRRYVMCWTGGCTQEDVLVDHVECSLSEIISVIIWQCMIRTIRSLGCWIQITDNNPIRVISLLPSGEVYPVKAIVGWFIHSHKCVTIELGIPLHSKKFRIGQKLALKWTKTLADLHKWWQSEFTEHFADNGLLHQYMSRHGSTMIY